MGFKGKSISVASYDAGNRLTAWNRAGADENHSQTWDYDDAGNWNSTTKDGDTESRDHSVSNQITQLDGKAVSHDLKGNLTDYEYDRTDYRVKYDLDNRIVEVKADSETIRYRYDALGRRIVSKGDDETVLIWWGDSECAEYEHRASQDAIQNDIMGHPTRLNSVIARDTEDRENRVELQWYHKNYLDHVYAVSDDNGNLIEHYRYTAFGEPEIYSATGAKRNTSAIDNTVMWNTRRYDANNGLYYYKYRHYAANIGRWLGRDPIEENGGQENLYAFVDNECFSFFDVLGLKGSDASCVVKCSKKCNISNDTPVSEALKNPCMQACIKKCEIGAEVIEQDVKWKLAKQFAVTGGDSREETASKQTINKWKLEVTAGMEASATASAKVFAIVSAEATAKVNYGVTAGFESDTTKITIVKSTFNGPADTDCKFCYCIYGEHKTLIARVKGALLGSDPFWVSNSSDTIKTSQPADQPCPACKPEL